MVVNKISKLGRYLVLLLMPLLPVIGLGVGCANNQPSVLRVYETLDHKPLWIEVAEHGALVLEPPSWLKNHPGDYEKVVCPVLSYKPLYAEADSGVLLTEPPSWAAKHQGDYKNNVPPVMVYKPMGGIK